jgi:arylsulfatase A-like enzyme
MRRRARRALLLAAVLTVAALPAAPAASAAPNVLVIVTDDQRAGLVAMPFTKQIFQRSGVRFPLAYVTDPLCCPSRASIMTGRYPHNTGVKSNAEHPDLGVGGASALDPSTTVQRYLHDAGYATALFGKYLNHWDLSVPPPYFDEYVMVRTQGDYFHNLVSVGSAGVPPSLYETSGTYSTSLIRRRAARFIRAHADESRPFFLYVAPNAPHAPFTAEESYAGDTFGKWRGNPAVGEADKSDKPLYVQDASATLAAGRSIRTRQYRTLESVDDLVEALYTELRTAGEARDTLTFFVSDNGYLWGEHGLTAKDAPYIPSVKVPFLARWPAGPLAGGTVDVRAAANVDVAPTILDAAGLPLPPEIDGRSLLLRWDRPRQYTEHWCNVDRCLFWAAERTTAYHYIEYYDGPDFTTAAVVFREFYDLESDPFELENLLGDADPANDPDVSAIAAELAADRSCMGSSCP